MKPPENVISFEAEKSKRSREGKLRLADWCEETFANFLYGGKSVDKNIFEGVFAHIRDSISNAEEEVTYSLKGEYKGEDIKLWFNGENTPEDENLRRNILQKLLINLSEKIRREKE